MGLPQRYVAFLAEHGINLQDVFCVDDIALDRDSTLQAIDILAEEGAVILGGDAHLMSDRKLRFALANWFTERLPGEGVEALARRSVSDSRNYVAQFNDRSGDTPYFSLVVDQDR